MTRVLVTTVPDDIHAAAVTCALRRKGHEVVTWYGTDLPTTLAASMRIGEDDAAIALDDVEIDDVDSVWFRRPALPVLPEDLHPADRPIAARELDAFVRGLVGAVAPRACWVNPLEGHRRAGSKLIQLRAARAAGLTIPDTLVSNDPSRIRAFLRAHGGDVVYKPLRPSVWTGPDGVACTFTTAITEDVLPDDDLLRLTPGIFQPLIRKRHELRATFLGDHVVTARVRSQDDAATAIDWRATGGRPPLEPDTLPAPVEAACRALMRRLGIVFGCFDLIVTPDGEHVFLEVNEMGQWIWIEEALPETRLLDRFTELLAQARPDFAWPARDPLTFADVEAEAVAHVARAEAEHLAAPADHLAVEDPPPPPDDREVVSPQRTGERT